LGYPYGGNACDSVAPCKSCLNPASSQNSPAGNYGNIRKGSLVGPQYTDWEMALVRNFSMKEKADLLLRAEHFNVLNHRNFWRSGNHQQLAR
jgi:hypothetical protein